MTPIKYSKLSNKRVAAFFYASIFFSMFFLLIAGHLCRTAGLPLFFQYSALKVTRYDFSLEPPVWVRCFSYTQPFPQH